MKAPLLFWILLAAAPLSVRAQSVTMNSELGSTACRDLRRLSDIRKLDEELFSIRPKMQDAFAKAKKFNEVCLEWMSNPKIAEEKKGSLEDTRKAALESARQYLDARGPLLTQMQVVTNLLASQKEEDCLFRVQLRASQLHDEDAYFERTLKCERRKGQH